MKYYVICPVREADKTTKQYLEQWVEKREQEGHEVYYPATDTDQTDDGIGLNICNSHKKAMLWCDTVAIWWEPTSYGSHVDFGMAYVLDKPIILINTPETTPHKSYTNVIKHIAEPPDSLK